MIRTPILLGVLLAHNLAAVSAAETEDASAHRLPKPLEAIVCDFGVLEKHFKVVESKHYAADEFAVGGRVVAEETIVWTLKAKEPLNGGQVYDLLHPNPSPSPFLKVRALRMVDGKPIGADTRERGYALLRDLRFINRKAAPDLAKGDTLQVWVHLGKEGSAVLLEKKAEKLVVTAK